jgi:hypothetical protein
LFLGLKDGMKKRIQINGKPAKITESSKLDLLGFKIILALFGLEILKLENCRDLFLNRDLECVKL